MNIVKKYLQSPVFWLVLTLVFYIVGAIIMERPDVESLKEMGIAEQEVYVVTDQDGEEHYSESYIDVKGIGRVLTYKDIYFATFPVFIFALIFGGLVLNNGEIFRNPNEIEHVIFANCILGVLLIWLTTKGNIPSTILYWLGIIAAGHAVKIDKPKNNN